MVFGVTHQCLFSEEVTQGFDLAVKVLSGILVQSEEKKVKNEKAFMVKSICTSHILF